MIFIIRWCDLHDKLKDVSFGGHWVCKDCLPDLYNEWFGKPRLKKDFKKFMEGK